VGSEPEGASIEEQSLGLLARTKSL